MSAGSSAVVENNVECGLDAVVKNNEVILTFLPRYSSSSVGEIDPIPCERSYPMVPFDEPTVI